MKARLPKNASGGATAMASAQSLSAAGQTTGAVEIGQLATVRATNSDGSSANRCAGHNDAGCYRAHARRRSGSRQAGQNTAHRRSNVAPDERMTYGRTQLPELTLGIPKTLATTAIAWPARTCRTASSLNSRVHCACSARPFASIATTPIKPIRQRTAHCAFPERQGDPQQSPGSWLSMLPGPAWLRRPSDRQQSR